MDELMVFQNPEFGEIRAQEIDGEPWFCLADVCKPLGIQSRDCRKRLREDGVVSIHLVDSIGRPASMLFVNEGNLYRAIFQSKKPEAEKFTDWVTEEVLPSIRKTGGYLVKPLALLSPAEQLAAQAQLLVELERKTEQATEMAKATAQRLDRALAAFSRPAADHWREDMMEAVRTLCEARGLTEPATLGRMYLELERETGSLLGSRLARLRKRKQKAGCTRREYMALGKLDAVAADHRLRPVFEGIVRKWQAVG